MNKSTRIFELYEVVKVPFPFADANTVKVRPALIVSDARHFGAKIGVSIMAMITSKKPFQELWPTDILIEDINQAGLPVPSLIRFKLFTLDNRLILGPLGSLSKNDQADVKKALFEILHL